MSGAVERDARELAALIRAVPDFPREGILFRDITTLLKDAGAFRRAVDRMAEALRGDRVTKVLGVESRGFILGAPLALELGAGFVPVRKKGRLPAPAVSATYELEYGSDTLEMHRDALQPGERAALVDDLLATGGTAEACVRMARELGAEVARCAFFVELTALGGRERLAPLPVFSLIRFGEDD